ncbi:hypothetical protein G6011_05741 [Alternaria panax]|uniref:Cytochrome P450 n=1 Tax=Alternaria panax TaxID=48097 RepID=A0AAD4FD72_9PLEO|nr:hypothetical protein G6011_05741 [Alternaria panax]
MVGNAAPFMVVGSETTATVLPGTPYLLLKFPKCMRRLKEEIHDRFGSKEEMTIEALLKLTYMTAVLDEAIRVYPGAPETLAKLVSPGGNADLCRDDKNAFNPFSVGPRACLGRNLVHNGLRLALSHLLWDFDFELDETSDG